MTMTATAKDALSRVLYPILLGLPLGVWAWMWYGVGWDPSMALQVVYWGSYALLIFLERLIPFERAWLKNDGQIKVDVFYTVVALAANSLATVVCLWLLVWLIKSVEPVLSFHVWPTHWPFAVQVIVGIAIWDLGNHLAHRWAHKVAFLWRFHSVHHAAPRLSVINTGRLHPFDVVKSVVIGAPIPVLLGIPEDVSLWYAAFNVFIGQLTHSNVNLKCGVFNYFLSTPNLHRWHHSPHKEETDTNFGETTMIWDRVFGTYFNPARTPWRNVGLGADGHVSRKLWESLFHPFTPKGHRASGADRIVELPAGEAGIEHEEPAVTAPVHASG